MILLTLIFLLIITTSNTAVFSQDMDSVLVSEWNFDELGMKELEFEIKYDRSAGWFPSIPNGYSSLGFLGGGSIYYHDRGENVKSQAFGGTQSKLSASNFDIMSNSERQTSGKFRYNSTNLNHNMQEFGLLGLSFSTTIGLPFMVVTELAYMTNQSILGTESKRLPYLNLDNEIKTVSEREMVHLCENSIFASIGPRIPFYGGYFKLGDMFLMSVYYIEVKAFASYALSMEMTNYLHIQSGRENLRYTNGYDRLTLYESENPNFYNQMRFGYQLGIGWQLNLGNTTGVSFGLNLHSFQTSIVKDSDWKQSVYGIYSSIFF